MPRGRHRHSPPLHRLLPPSVIAGVSVVCAVGPWLFTEPLVLRGLAAGAAVTTIVGSVVMRRWDVAAGKRVADLTRARASDEWRHEERVAELETDLEESRELRAKLEQRLRAKRTELANLRNEHAALLRRYATAETERASALEGRRLLAIEAAPASPELSASVAEAPATEPEKDAGPALSAPRAFSPEGSALFAAAQEALARLARGEDLGAAGEPAADAGAASEKDTPTRGGPDDGGGERASADPDASDAPEGPETLETLETATPEVGAEAEPAREQEPPAASKGQQPQPPAAMPPHTTGHFTVPTAVAVVPSAPRPRPAVEGGFDFFGTKSRQSLESVQNEDLADVVGQEALAVHKAESESGFKSAGPEERAVGQVIDLTAHDETERIDVQGLRTAAY
ncbi:hypothetical protein ACFYZJ_34580 [Streptomyces sp. NPDC001848]|uniref:hypothetical protein n=1 Tax=Streptomyces sp. NPDC001848 TaxID=3364618 RepID=UPI0036B75728